MRYLTTTLLLTFGLLLSSPVLAEDPAPTASAPDIPKPLKVMPVKIKPVQGATDELSKAAPDTQTGLSHADGARLEMLNPLGNYGFQADFWENSTRKDIITFLSQKEGITPNRIIRDLTLRAILTPAPNISSSDSATENLYALRLQRLVNLGDFETALKLYKMNEDSPPTPLAARAGIESMVGHGEIAVACLEQKALDKPLKMDTPQLWANIDVFCQALLSPVAGNDSELRMANASRIYLEATQITPPSTTENLNDQDIIATVALAKGDKISGILSTQESVNKLTDNKIALLLTFLPPTSTAYLPTLATALNRGIISDESAITKLEAANVTDTSNIYSALLTEYLKEKPPILTASLLDMADTSTKKSLLLPLYTAPEIAFPENKKKLSLSLLAKANQPLPANLVRSAFMHPESQPVTEEMGEKLLFSYLFETTKPDDTTIYPWLLAIKPLFEPDNPQKTAYDNILSLTAQSNYVMPMGDILSSLKKSADEKQTDQVVIKSLEILSETPLEHLHPAALYRILEALNSAGLSEETMSLARDVLGTLLEK